jgi:hypothetical protein
MQLQGLWQSHTATHTRRSRVVRKSHTFLQISLTCSCVLMDRVFMILGMSGPAAAMIASLRTQILKATIAHM